jgi:hypothetical protein
MSSRYIVVSPDAVIRIRPYPSRRQRTVSAVVALLPEATAFLMATVLLLTVLANA